MNGFIKTICIGTMSLLAVIPIACATEGTEADSATVKGDTMNDTVRPLPFGLNRDQLADVRVLYGFISGKTGAGRQEITIAGDGTVTLFFTPTRDAEPLTREGRVSTEVVIALLDVMESQGMLGLEDHYRAEHFTARRVLELALPGQTKTVKLDEPGVLNFERIAGAVMLAAGMALPEALNHRFFPNL